MSRRYRVPGWHHARGMPPQPVLAPRLCACGHEVEPWHRGGECMRLGCGCRGVQPVDPADRRTAP